MTKSGPQNFFTRGNHRRFSSRLSMVARSLKRSITSRMFSEKPFRYARRFFPMFFESSRSLGKSNLGVL